MRHRIATVGRVVAAAGLIASAAGTAQGQTDPETLTISSGINSLTLNARAQFRWTLDDREDFDADTTGSGVLEPDGPFTQFEVPQLRVSMSGGAFRPWLHYTFQFEFSRTSGENDSKIKDAMLEIEPVGRRYRLVIGQFKAPFGLQELTSSGRQQFVDRAITEEKFTPGRDMGAMFAGTLAAGKVGYEIGVFNGSGESARQNTQLPLVAGRVYVQPLGAYSLSEGASDAPERPVLHLGFGARGGSAIRGRSAAGVVEDADNQSAFNLEFAYKAGRFFSTAEYFLMIDERQNPVASRNLRSRGFHAQAGVMLRPRTVEIGARIASIEGDTSIGDAALTEWRGVIGYYWRGHSLKLQADAGQLRYGAAFATLPSAAQSGLVSIGPRLVSGEALSDTQVRVQMQLAF